MHSKKVSILLTHISYDYEKVLILCSNGTFGITLSFALIGGISISISGELFYEGNE